MVDKFSRLQDTLITEIKNNYPTDILGGDPAQIGRNWGNFLTTNDPQKYTAYSPRNLALALIFYHVKKARNSPTRYDENDFKPGGIGYRLVTGAKRSQHDNITETDLVAMSSLIRYVKLIHIFIAEHPELF
jgi:hypothetical protein